MFSGKYIFVSIPGSVRDSADLRGYAESLTDVLPHFWGKNLVSGNYTSYMKTINTIHCGVQMHRSPDGPGEKALIWGTCFHAPSPGPSPVPSLRACVHWQFVATTKVQNCESGLELFSKLHCLIIFSFWICDLKKIGKIFIFFASLRPVEVWLGPTVASVYFSYRNVLVASCWDDPIIQSNIINENSSVHFTSKKVSIHRAMKVSFQ